MWATIQVHVQENYEIKNQRISANFVHVSLTQGTEKINWKPHKLEKKYFQKLARIFANNSPVNFYNKTHSRIVVLLFFYFRIYPRMLFKPIQSKSIFCTFNISFINFFLIFFLYIFPNLFHSKFFMSRKLIFFCVNGMWFMTMMTLGRRPLVSNSSID